MKNKIAMSLIAISVAFGFSINSFAQTTVAKSPQEEKQPEKVGGFFFEPGLVLETGRTSANDPSSNSAGSSDGFGGFLRAGYHMGHILFAALDGRVGISQFHDAAVNYSAKATSANWSLDGGLQFPKIGLRGWIGYIFAGFLNPDASGNGLDLRYSGASGYRIGFGWPVSFASVNLEFQQLRYGKTRVEQAGPYGSSNFGSTVLSDSTLLASISMPLEF